MAEHSLLGLPRELRDMIYSLVLPKRVRLARRASTKSHAFYDNHGILLVNHQLRAEALDALLPHTTFIISADEDSRTLETRDCPNRARMKNLLIKVWCKKRNLHDFALSHVSGLWSTTTLGDLHVTLPGLEKVVFDLSWKVEAPWCSWTRHTREWMLQYLRDSVEAQRIWTGWDADYALDDSKVLRSASVLDELRR
ncbi:hypothetical protein P153DRAFT_380176 [Dothidotthia symphoricarpi CBS 119687]|uniref:F-box domain-containing protein n=1 Tax=Dothidotthia symphoricarpi CBS 119687 TaxID=1392245 RepID=A0A6A6AQZ3_9PLEO|nr:uncharacterized protein P153DRAFT_380176 [Dothidotthia symphoricarpi CBS 119687]KAF2134359.1 hypothetical protein P153DRAFT_380176 [Dothidotthia symphoricarpi CBS 119687]